MLRVSLAFVFIYLSVSLFISRPVHFLCRCIFCLSFLLFMCSILTFLYRRFCLSESASTFVPPLSLSLSLSLSLPPYVLKTAYRFSSPLSTFFVNAYSVCRSFRLYVAFLRFFIDVSISESDCIDFLFRLSLSLSLSPPPLSPSLSPSLYLCLSLNVFKNSLSSPLSTFFSLCLSASASACLSLSLSLF